MKLKIFRLNSGKTQQEIAEILNIKTRTYCNYENETRKIPLALLIELSNYYKINIEDLLK